MGLFKESKPAGWDESFGNHAPTPVVPQSEYDRPTQTHDDVVGAQVDVEARKWGDKKSHSMVADTDRSPADLQTNRSLKRTRHIGIAALAYLTEPGTFELLKRKRAAVRRHLGEFALAA